MLRLRTALAALPVLTALALTAPAAADVKDGVDAWQTGNYQKAVTEWRPLAIAGDPDAQFNLGQAYKLGRGVTPDLAQAETWYRRAAKQGHLQAEDNLGLILFTVNRRAEAMPYILASAARGEPRAQYVLGTAHFNGDFADKDWPRAYALTKRASDAGLDIASARLAQLDRLIPLEMRQRGLAMLPDIEKDEQRARLAAVNAAAPPSAVNAAAPSPAALPAPVKAASVPASVPGTSYVPPPLIVPGPVPTPTPAAAPAKPKPTAIAANAAAAAAEATAAANAATAGGMAQPAPAAAAIAAKPAPAKPAPVKPAAATDGPWRAQLGAFGVEANAVRLWSALGKQHPAIAARKPLLVKAGTVTRLQAGFASQGEAQALCAAVVKSGKPCMVVAN